MTNINYKEIARDYRNHGGGPVCRSLTEAITEGSLKAEDFSIKQLAESLVSRDWVDAMDPRRGLAVLESSDGVDSTAFSNITGQLVINELMAGYNKAAYVITDLFRTISTRLNGETIPGMGDLGDKGFEVHEGMPYPNVGLGEDFVETPRTTKHGLIVPVTKEAVFFDRTGLILERARKVGEALRLRKEKRCVDVLIGKVNTYKWQGTKYNTYLAGGAWTNILAGAEHSLKDWEQLDAAELLFADLKDPHTDEPIVVMPNAIVASPFKKNTINRILTATRVTHTGNGVETESSNPLSSSGYSTVTSHYFYSRLQSELGMTAEQAKETMILGDFGEAFAYMENWPVTVVQAPQNSEAEFNQDIVARFKASERGTPAVRDPRYVAMVKGFDE